jgi:MFS family permease
VTIPAAKPRLSREVVVLGIIAFFVMVGFGVVIPVLPVFVRSFHVGYTEVGAVVSAFALMRLVASPFCGKLIDWVGERTILAIGIGIVAVSSAMVGLAQSYLEVLLLRGAGGIGSAMFSISAMTLLLGTTAPSMRGRAVGFYQGGFLIGGMAGPAIGGLLAVISLRAPFFFYAGTLILAGVVGLAFLRPVSRHKKSAGPEAVSTIPFRAVISDRRFRAACLANFASGWASLGVRSALIPVLVVEVLHREELWTLSATSGPSRRCSASTAWPRPSWVRLRLRRSGMRREARAGSRSRSSRHFPTSGPLSDRSPLASLSMRCPSRWLSVRRSCSCLLHPSMPCGCRASASRQPSPRSSSSRVTSGRWIVGDFRPIAPVLGRNRQQSGCSDDGLTIWI